MPFKDRIIRDLNNTKIATQDIAEKNTHKSSGICTRICFLFIHSYKMLFSVEILIA